MASNEALRLRNNNYRTSYLRRLGISPNYGSRDVLVCSCHPLDADGLPSAVGVASSLSPSTEPSRGVGSDRAKRNYEESLAAESEWAAALSAVLDAVERELAEKCDEVDELRGEMEESTTGVRLLRWGLVKNDPDLLYSLTRFSCADAFESYLLFLSNGNIDSLVSLRRFSYANVVQEGSTRSYNNPSSAATVPGRRDMSVYDEFLLYFARETARDNSYDYLRRNFGLSFGTIFSVIITCTKFVALRRRAFGEVLSIEDYRFLVSEQFQRSHPNVYRVYTDSSNISLRGASSMAVLQRLTWNDYYNECCFKFNVCNYPGCWVFVTECYTGNIGDTDLFLVTRVAERVAEVVGDNVDVIIEHVTDKGYRLALHVLSLGQRHTTPVFRHVSVDQFTPMETIVSTCVARDRAESERSVLRVCRPSIVANGVSMRQMLALTNDIIGNAAFRTNFTDRMLTCK